MQRRLASHYIYCGGAHRMAYLELDKENRFQGVYPLTAEIAGTAFYDGILVPLPLDDALFSLALQLSTLVCHPAVAFKEQLFARLAESGLTDRVEVGRPVAVYRLTGIDLTSGGQAAAEFGADHGRGDRYVQRL